MVTGYSYILSVINVRVVPVDCLLEIWNKDVSSWVVFQMNVDNAVAIGAVPPGY